MLRMFIAILNPWPTSPSRFPAGTAAFSRNSDAVEEPRIPILCSSWPTVKPGVARSTMKAVCCSPSTLANTVNTSAKAAFEMNCFAPDSTQRPSAPRVARVRMDIASEPAVGSVRA